MYGNIVATDSTATKEMKGSAQAHGVLQVTAMELPDCERLVVMVRNKRVLEGR